jgi:hypothetical protein
MDAFAAAPVDRHNGLIIVRVKQAVVVVTLKFCGLLSRIFIPKTLAEIARQPPVM